MRSENQAFFLFGGTFLNNLQPHLQEMGTIAGALIGTSPISEISAVDNGGLTWWLPELDARLAKADAEYFVLDLQQARQNLLVAGGCAVSVSARNLKALQRKEVAVVDPMTLTAAEVEEAIDCFAQVVAKHFPGERIILIQTPYPAFHLEGNNLRPQSTFPVSAKHAQWMENLEKRFREKTCCRMVDVTRFYFYSKETGRPLTDVIFEKECYQDVAYRIGQILAGGYGTAAHPRFDLSLDRYANYYFTMQKKPQRVFLDAGRFLDKLVLSTTDTFVRAHREKLIALDALDWSQPETALATMEQQDPNGLLTRVFRAFWAVCKGKYALEGVDYAAMFQCEVVPEELVKRLKEDYAPKAGLLPVQINRYNAGCYFAKMQGLDPRPFTTELTVEKPTAVDIFGSCISRTLFNIKENDFAVNKYWFHVAPFEYRNKPFEYDPAIFPEKPTWTDRLVKQQLDCTIYEDVRKSKAEWLLIDLYALVSGYIYRVGDCLYGDFDRRVSGLIKAQKVDLYRDPSVFGDHEALVAALDPWLDLIKKKYGNKIILVDGQRMHHWIGDDGKLYQDKKPSDCNPFWTWAAECVSKKLGCYRISLGRHFLPDELGLMRNTPAHKEDLGYMAAHDTVRYIVDRQPEEKWFDRYSGRIHMDHLERMAKHNGVPALEAALPLSELDKAVIRLGYEEMVKRHDQLAALYDASDWTKPLEEILGSAEPELAKLLAEAAKKPAGKTTKLPTGHSAYAAEDKVFYGRNAGCPMPKFPEAKGFKVVCEKDTIRITWTAAQDVCVQVYRKSKETPWVMVDESTTGLFVDMNVQADTEYHYRLCTKVKHEGRQFSGGFTAIKSARVPVGTPVLVSAVHLNGVNMLRWKAVEGADAYRVYHKDTAAGRWEPCAVVDAAQGTVYSEASKFPAGGEWYTVRALKDKNGASLAGGFQQGLCAKPL